MFKGVGGPGGRGAKPPSPPAEGIQVPPGGGYTGPAAGRPSGKAEIERALKGFSSVRQSDSYRFQLDFGKHRIEHRFLTLSLPNASR